MDDEKTGIGHNETLRDEDVIGTKRITSEEAEHLRQLSPEELVAEKKLRRKIDSLIMPIVVVVYLMNYIDRNNYAAARLQGLERDLNLVGNQYQTGLSILFVGYVRRDQHSMQIAIYTDELLGPYASSIERCDELRRQAIALPWILHRSMGPCLLADLSSSKLRQHRGLSIHSGHCRGAFLCRRTFLPLQVVH